jgi:hypothetical protein
MPVLGRAVVFHDWAHTGQRIGCGLVAPSDAEVVSIGGYPGYGGELSVRGMLLVDDTRCDLPPSPAFSGLL